ncbi:hypothetical protein N7468_008654 [Penicillium chermesinum]|uniref:Nucleoside phosphorylase domain-containing protein n=1 Tax=Penicillium chermesinum TaxID=63820 RepID=A0A9W9NQ54_9EURO|nr:uncharacterized protein N7468_008654 [Penicillium chermesinum]KAJ5224112.1 hypothetical protein N7468_008654 [Penicillium chermesinum]
MVSNPPKSRNEFDVAVICALPFEADTVDALFDYRWDEESDRYGKAPGDRNTYRTGLIGSHNVVLVCMPGIGRGHAAGVAANLRSSFQNIRLALMVGVCGGVPNGAEKGIFLGDIIISDEIVVYDFGRQYPAGFRRKEGITESTLNPEVRTFLQRLKSPSGHKALLKRARHHLTKLQQTGHVSVPVLKQDRLFPANYHHKHQNHAKCKRCRKNENCQKAQESTCVELGCDQKAISRSRLLLDVNDVNDIHFGRIASGDTVMKSGTERNRVALADNIIAFEMEGAGIYTNLPCLVVKGVCDYADSHKDKEWQLYAARTAASCMKSALEQWPKIDRSDEGPKTYTGPLLEASHGIEPSAEPQSQSICLDEGSHSQNIHPDPVTGTDQLFQILPEVELAFKETLACFKRKSIRKFLPRDFGLKQYVRNQQIIYLDCLRSLTSQDRTYEGNDQASQATRRDVILSIKEKLEEISDLAKCLPVSTKATLDSTNATDVLKESVEDLESRVQVLLSLMTQAEEPSSFINDTVTANHARNREFKHFQVIQKAAYSLYDALGTACNKHTTHDVHLSLQPSFERSSSQVQFNVAFLQKSASAMQEIWIKVESTIKSADTDSPSISTVTSRRLPSFKRPTQYPEASSSSEVRKRVCFEERIGPDNPGQCILNDRLQESRIYTYSGTFVSWLKEFYTGRPAKALVWLSSIDPMQCMSQYRRIQLAKYLATAVLCYHATPWLNTAWRSDDVRFLGGPESLLQKASCTLPYMVTSVQASSQSSSPSHPSELHYIVRNRVLFGLGVMFLELAYQTPLQKLRLPIDLERGQTPELAEYFTARRVVDQSASMMGGRFKRMIKKCLYCDFGHDSDFTSPALQQAFYNDIIGGLEDLEEKFRELQLDE